MGRSILLGWEVELELRPLWRRRVGTKATVEDQLTAGIMGSSLGTRAKGSPRQHRPSV